MPGDAVHHASGRCALCGCAATPLKGARPASLPCQLQTATLLSIPQVMLRNRIPHVMLKKSVPLPGGMHRLATLLHSCLAF